MQRFPSLISALLALAALLASTSSVLAAASTPIPLANSGSWCLPSNSSCVDDVWWQAQSDRTSARFRQATASYAGLDGLHTDPDFAEAVRLLWQWPEGRQELLGAAKRGVRIVLGPKNPKYDSDSFATYDEDTLSVEVAYEDLDVPTWMVADLLAHELRHANDLAKGEAAWAGTTGCLGLEGRAYATEQRYMRWLVSRFGAFPSAEAELEAELSYAADDLYTNLARIYQSADAAALVQRDYADTCADA